MKKNEIPLELYSQIVKGQPKQKVVTRRGLNAITYTRVSTKEQADNNLSLLTQRKFCDLFAEREGIVVKEYFGGTYESAQSDERKEFKRMMDYVRKSKEKISYIIVYSVDRFSRSGENAIYIASQLKQNGVQIFSVTQPTDTSTPNGSFQQNLFFLFSQYENDQRREKCMTGTKEMLLRGEWPTQAPIGYDHIRVNGQRKIVANEKGKLIRKAFLWKANEGLTIEEIVKRLAEQGLKLYHQSVSKILRNPFYCGLMAHNLLDGELLEGNHEKIISKEIFVKANNELAKSTSGFKWDKEMDEKVPLKKFVRCANCGSPMRGYIVKKKKIYYYKCNNKCNCNKSAKALNEGWANFLTSFGFDEKYFAVIKDEVVVRLEELAKERFERCDQIENELKELDKKIERLDERYIMIEDITKPQYDKFISKYKEEKELLEQQLSKTPIKKSNLAKCAEAACQIASNFHNLWVSSKAEMKKRLQFLLFPEGIFYDKKNDECRTGRMNTVFTVIRSILEKYNNIKKGEIQHCLNFAPLVARTGVEPVTSGL